MTTVTTIDDRQVDASSEAWRLCCEAVWALNKPHVDRERYFAMVRKHRGEEGVRYLQEEMSRIEPAYLLALPDRDARRAYLDRAEPHIGPVQREHLEQRIVALWEQRKAAKAA